MKSQMHSLCNKFTHIANKLQCPTLFLTRIVLGFVFTVAGWGKLNNLENVIGFFSQLGIPAPHIQAPFVAGLEFVGGLMLLAGFFTRLISIPLAFTMVVAIATAKASEVTGIGDLFGLSEFLYIVLFIVLITNGAGNMSVDAFLEKRCCSKQT